jgi:hypothetical protein
MKADVPRGQLTWGTRVFGPCVPTNLNLSLPS